MSEASSADNVAIRLRWVRNHFGLSQTQFAASVDAKIKQYNHWEKGRQRLSLEGALRINAVYGISLDFLFLGRLDALSISMLESLASLPRNDAD